jgi:hypothetical protein
MMKGSRFAKVSVFPLKVDQELDTWPEAHERQSGWFEPSGAVSLVKEEGLRDLINLFVDRAAEPASK